MKKDNIHNIEIRLSALLLSIALLTPALIKLHHAGLEHHHELCLVKSSKHIHTNEWDCDFDIYNLSEAYEIKTFTSVFILSDTFNKNYFLTETFVEKSRDYSIFQRGPPRLV